METEEKKYPLIEVADMLNISIPTIYRYLSKGIVNKEISKEGKNVISESQFQLLKETLNPPGITVKKAAEQLGVSKTIIFYYIRCGQLRAVKRRYKGQQTYFIDEEEFKTFSKSYKRGKNFIHLDSGLYLYQSLLHSEHSTLARVMSVNDKGIVKTNNGEVMEICDALKKGYTPTEQYIEKEWITKVGHIEIQFKKPRIITNRVYDVIETFYRLIGKNNIRLFEMDNQLKLEIKPCTLSAKEFPLSDVEWISDKITEGSIVQKYSQIRFETELETIVIHLPKKEKEELMRRAKESKKSVGEYLKIALDLNEKS